MFCFPEIKRGKDYGQKACCAQWICPRPFWFHWGNVFLKPQQVCFCPLLPDRAGSHGHRLLQGIVNLANCDPENRRNQGSAARGKEARLRCGHPAASAADRLRVSLRLGRSMNRAYKPIVTRYEFSPHWSPGYPLLSPGLEEQGHLISMLGGSCQWPSLVGAGQPSIHRAGSSSELFSPRGGGDRQGEAAGYKRCEEQEGPCRLWKHALLPWSRAKRGSGWPGLQTHPSLRLSAVDIYGFVWPLHNSTYILFWETLLPLMDVGLVGASTGRSSKEDQSNGGVP